MKISDARVGQRVLITRGATVRKRGVPRTITSHFAFATIRNLYRAGRDPEALLQLDDDDATCLGLVADLEPDDDPV